MTTNKLIESVNLSAAKIMVVGDVMLDQYWYGGTSRISPEAPVPVVRVNKTDNRLGGAANVANNLIALGAKVKLLGITGNDAPANLIANMLLEANIEHSLAQIEGYTTIIKLRILSRQQQMIRLDHEDEYKLSGESLKPLYDSYANNLAKYNMVILSDYAKGVLSNPRPFIDSANALGIPVLVDPKNNNFAVYKGAQIIKPNLNEFEAIVGKCSDLNCLEEKARNLLEYAGVDTLVITRGAEGISVVTKDSPAVHVPAFSGDVYDVTGAGDTVVAVLAAALASGVDLFNAVNLSSMAAGIVVGKVGTSKVTLQEIKAKYASTQKLPTGVMEEEALRGIIKLSQANGEKVVFVNGCYDIIHYGHIRYLERAKALGDRLIVGVNSDASVKRTKGEERPHYNLQQRMEVLAGLKAVDWVVPFEENTPGRLVESLSPDVLVKSGDYYTSIDQIPAEEGAAHVLARGGELHLLSRTDGCSTTQVFNLPNFNEIV